VGIISVDCGWGWKQGVKYRKAVFRSGFHAGTVSDRQSYLANRLLPASSQPPTMSDRPITALGHPSTTYGYRDLARFCLSPCFVALHLTPLVPSLFIFLLFSPPSFASQARGDLLVYHPLLAWLLSSQFQPAALFYCLCF
jgi:hypothetical protein